MKAIYSKTVPIKFAQTLVLRGISTLFVSVPAVLLSLTPLTVFLGAGLSLFLFPPLCFLNAIFTLIGGIAIARHQSFRVALLPILESLAGIAMAPLFAVLPIYRLGHDTAPPMNLPIAIYGFLTGGCHAGITLLAPWPKSRLRFALLGGLSLLMGVLFLKPVNYALPILGASLIQLLYGVCLLTTGRFFEKVNAERTHEE